MRRRLECRRLLREKHCRLGAVEAVDATRAVDCQIRNSLEPHNRTAILRSKSAIRANSRAHGSEVGNSPNRCAKAREHQMVKNALLCFALASTGVIGAALELGVNYALAADDCITESNLVPPKGTRWDYRIDRAANRKCWFLIKVTTAPVAPQTRRALPRSTPARVSPEHRSVRNLSESEQAALFLEFLRWKEQQSAVNSSAAAESLRGTISP
jgi:hypothetical protein